MVRTHAQRIALLIAAAGATSALAAGPTIEKVIAATDPIPGAIAGSTWQGGFVNGLGTPAIDKNGNVAFVARVTGSDTPTISNQRATFYGAPVGAVSGAMSMIARDGTAALTYAGAPVGWVHNSIPSGTNPASFGLNTALGLLENGDIVQGSTLNGVGATASNNNAMFYGAGSAGAAGISMYLRTGDAAPGIGAGTAPAVFSSSLNLSPFSNQVNSNGVTLFTSNITGGDVVGTTNNSGLFLSAGKSGSGIPAKLVLRTGDAAPGVAAGGSGPAVPTLAAVSTFGFHLGGDYVSASEKLTVSALSGVTTANDEVMYVGKPGAMKLVAREGSAVPGVANAFYAASLSNSARSLNTAGQSVFLNAITGPGVTVGVDDQAAMLWDPNGNGGLGSTSVLVRKNAILTGGLGTNLTVGVMNTNNNQLLNTGNYIFGASIGGAAAGQDQAIIFHNINTGADTIAMQRGMLLPGYTDVAISASAALASGSFLANNKGDILFFAALAGTGVTTGVNDQALLAWDPIDGLSILARTGDAALTAAVGFAPTSFQIGSTTISGDNTCEGFTDNGWLTFIVKNSAQSAIVRMQYIPAPSALALLGVSGMLVGRRRRR